MLHLKPYGYGHKEITAIVVCVEDADLSAYIQSLSCSETSTEKVL